MESGEWGVESGEWAAIEGLLSLRNPMLHCLAVAGTAAGWGCCSCCGGGTGEAGDEMGPYFAKSAKVFPKDCGSAESFIRADVDRSKL